MNTFFISDLHLGHINMIKFRDENGKLNRPNPETGEAFEDVDEMHAMLIKRWNEKVTPRDRVYVLGDIVFPKEAWSILDEFNGQKIPVLGNHDRHHDEIKERFERIYGAIDMGSAVCTHIPVHTSQLEYRWQLNIHGHTHHHNLIDHRYLNVSVEAVDFYPISADEITDIATGRGFKDFKLRVR